MVEIYSTNITVAQNEAIPFNVSKVAKGCTAVQTAPATVQLNKRGVYMVQVSGSIAPTAAGTVSFQLAKNGVLELGSFAEAAGTAGDAVDLSFSALVQVTKDNNPCCCADSPTTIQLVNTGEDGVYSIVRMIVTKLC